MAKELKELEQAEKAEQTGVERVIETASAEEEVVEARTPTGLKVERKAFKYNGSTCYDYFINGKLRGRPIVIHITAYDKGVDGYNYMDVVFNGKPSVDLVMYESKRTDFNGNVTRSTVYKIQDIDPVTGVVYDYRVRMKSSSDESQLKALLAERAALERAAKKTA